MLGQLLRTDLNDPGNDCDASNYTKAMRRTLDTVTKVSQEGKTGVEGDRERIRCAHPAARYCLERPTTAKEKETIPNLAEQVTSIEFYRQNWQTAYKAWREEVLKAAISPNEKQWQVLDLVHQRCVYEYSEEVDQHVNNTPEDQHWEPCFRMVHGLPGAGKSELLKWAKTYFETVWLWTMGIQFQFLAPMNQMAQGIGGETLHSFGGLKFQTAKGTTVNPGAAHLGADNVSKMVVKCKDLRFAFIDEFENMGVKIASDFEASLLRGVPTKHSLSLIHI